MKLSTRGRYGIRALLELALCDDKAPVSLRFIAERQQVSLPYLEQLIRPLIRAGLVVSTRGPAGGVSLTKLPEEIKLIDIYNALEGSTAPVDCVNYPQRCQRSGTCVTRDVWQEVGEAVGRVLESLTLKDLMERQKLKAMATPDSKQEP